MPSLKWQIATYLEVHSKETDWSLDICCSSDMTFFKLCFFSIMVYLIKHNSLYKIPLLIIRWEYGSPIYNDTLYFTSQRVPPFIIILEKRTVICYAISVTYFASYIIPPFLMIWEQWTLIFYAIWVTYFTFFKSPPFIVCWENFTQRWWRI